MKNISIIGSGSWGMALSTHLKKMGHNVKVWSFSQEEADIINNERKCKFLPNLLLPAGIYCTTNMQECIENTEIVLIVTPSKFVRETTKKFKQYINNQKIIICSKGLESSTLNLLSEVIKEELPNNEVGILCGPSHAEEVSEGVPTALVIASKSEDILNTIQSEFMNENLRVYTSTDVIGAEVGSSLKNIIALCAGIAYGLGYGDNTFAALATRGLVEITRLGIKMGAEQDTFYGLTGLGDLVVTCLSVHSRNRRAGMLIAKGKTIEEAKQEVGMVIESIDNIEIAYELAKKYDVEMPIINTVYNVLYNNLDPREGLKQLMTRQPKKE